MSTLRLWTYVNQRVSMTCINIVYFQVFDESALSTKCKEEMYKCYPDAKRAHLKTGGNFPYLARTDEVVTHLEVLDMYQAYYTQRQRFYLFNSQIHLMPFQTTRFSAKDPALLDPDVLKAVKGELDAPSSSSD